MHVVNNGSPDNVPLTCQLPSHKAHEMQTSARRCTRHNFVITDSLSRSPQAYTKEMMDTHSDVACHVAAVMGCDVISASPTKMDCLRKVPLTDCELQTVLTYVRSGWPENVASIALQAKEYSKVRNGMSEYDGLVGQLCRGQ